MTLSVTQDSVRIFTGDHYFNKKFRGNRFNFLTNDEAKQSVEIAELYSHTILTKDS